MPPARERHLILFAVAALLGGGVLLWTLIEITGVLLVLYVSGLLAIGFSPAVRWFERDYRQLTRRALPRWAAILLLYLLLGLAVVLVFAIVMPPFVRQVRALWEELPRYFDLLQNALQRAGVLSERWTSADVIAQLPNPGAAVAQVASALSGRVRRGRHDRDGADPAGYLLLEADSLASNFIQLFPRDRRSQISRLMAQRDREGRRVAQRPAAALGHHRHVGGDRLVGARRAVLLRVRGALGGGRDGAGRLGRSSSSVPAVLVGFSVSIHTGVFVAIYFIVQQFLENHFLVPRIMQQQVGVSAVTVLVALLVGTELLGFVGALLAVPSAAIVQVLVKEYLERE